ncbi:BrxA family protein [Metapseudomonas otitidis]|uniref:BrxA family protein n=1 Tax=Metapseudomonas otitidis TaxID=319939 RepID=UPI00366F3EDF
MSVQAFSYDSDLIGGSLQVRESRIVADLLLQNANAEQWYEVIQQENRLQKRTPASAKRVAQALRKRLERACLQLCVRLYRASDRRCFGRPYAAQVAFLARGLRVAQLSVGLLLDEQSKKRLSRCTRPIRD